VADVALYGIHVFRMPIFFVMAELFSAMLLGRPGTVGLLLNRAVRIGVPFVVGWLVLYPLLAPAGSREPGCRSRAATRARIARSRAGRRGLDRGRPARGTTARAAR
jgi:hypothetical protein